MLTIHNRIRAVTLTLLLTLMTLSACSQEAESTVDSGTLGRAKEIATAVDSYRYDFPSYENTRAARALYDGFRGLPGEAAIDVERAKAATALIEIYGNQKENDRDMARAIYDGLARLARTPEVDLARGEAALAMVNSLRVGSTSDSSTIGDALNLYEDIKALPTTSELDVVRAKAILQLAFIESVRLGPGQDGYKKFIDNLLTDVNKLSNTSAVNEQRGNLLKLLVETYTDSSFGGQTDDYIALAEGYAADLEKLPDISELKAARLGAAASLCVAWIRAGQKEKAWEILKKAPPAKALLDSHNDCPDYAVANIWILVSLAGAYQELHGDSAEVREIIKVANTIYKKMSGLPRTAKNRIGFGFMAVQRLLMVNLALGDRQDALIIWDDIKNIPGDVLGDERQMIRTIMEQ